MHSEIHSRQRNGDTEDQKYKSPRLILPISDTVRDNRLK
jgi:hypothetical protein